MFPVGAFRRIAWAGLAAFAVAAAALGQVVAIGNRGVPTSNFGSLGTILDLNSPARAAGRLDFATFTWSSAPCPAAALVKFFHFAPDASFVQFDQRGPFDVTTATQTVALRPPVSVQPGDEIAITSLTTCGGPTGRTPGSGAGGVIGFDNNQTRIFPTVLSPPFNLDVLIFASNAPYLALLSDRFHVQLQATDPRTGRTSMGRAIQQGDRFGYFSLPDFTGDPDFPEVIVKMANATLAPPPFGGSFWFFYSSLTDTSLMLTVTDTVTGRVKTYQSSTIDPSHICGASDTNAFQP